MSQNKKAYFQGGGGVNEPTPHKRKYKTEKAILVQPRFTEPFYMNYDTYETEGVNGHPKLGPGGGWHNMHKYKSISEFRDAKRKHMKDKYKADDSYIEDTKENRDYRISKMKIRANIFNQMIKIAMDFPIDDQIGSGSIIGDSGTYSDSAQIGGQLDEYLPLNDFEDKSPEQLNFGRDYVEDEDPPDVDRLIEKYLTPAEPGLFGMPDGIDSKEDLDMPSQDQQQYGTTNSGNTLYNGM